MTAAGPAVRRRDLLATGVLLATAACWGSTFFLIHDLSARVSAIDFLAIRFPIATLGLVLLFPRAVARLSPQARRRGVVLGLVYAGGQVLQTIGLAHTEASVSGFITGLYVVLTPLIAAVVLRQRLGPATWTAVALATLGIALLTLRPGGVAFGYGETLTLLASVAYALHIVGLGSWSRPGEALGLSIVQLATISVVCLAGAAPGGIGLPTRGSDWLAIVYMALVAGAFALVAQTWAQARLSPTRVAILISMEPVFAALFAVLVGQDPLTWRLLGGGGLVLVAMLVVELTPQRPVLGEVTHLTV